ncbi:MAG: hypothetical protein QM758_28130 [Armatimonas sp.]
MSDWKRTTTEATLESLRPELSQAIRKHVELYNLGEDLLAQPLLCLQTDSEKVKKGFFQRGGEWVYTGVVLTPRWIIWAVSGTKVGAATLSAQLRDITVQDYAQTQFAAMVPDCGVQVNGRFTDVSENGSAFIGLEDNVIGAKFKELAIQQVQSAKA